MNTDSINDYITKNLSEKRRTHTYAVRDLALELAEVYGADKEKIEAAALFHDMCKHFTEEEMNKYVRHFGLDPKYENNLNLAHSKVAVKLMERDFGICDRDILDAVSYHTTGRGNMTLIEKIIYVADATEPGRTYAGVEKIREMAFHDLDEACLLSLSKTIDFILSKNFYLDDDTARAVNYLRELKIKGASE